jgi:serine/threonine protein kinase
MSDEFGKEETERSDEQDAWQGDVPSDWETVRIEGGRAPAQRPEIKWTPESRYRIYDKLGEGGMASVYHAEDVMLERPVALKVMRPELVSDRMAVERFFHEAKILAEMDHPCIVPVYEQGNLSNFGPFYAMKEVAGQTLREMMLGRRVSDFTSPAVLRNFMQVFARVSETVAYAHSRDIIHRDLKPSNIMVDDFGVVLVMDWGLAKKTSGSGSSSPHRTLPGAVLGTPAYMAPEQASGKTDVVGKQSDVFSLGVMLYQILTGYLPFEGDSTKEIQESIKTYGAPDARGRNAHAPAPLAAICKKALEVDPGQRYACAREMAADIAAYQRGDYPSVYRPTPVERIATWTKRHRMVTGAIVAVIAVALFLGGLNIGQALRRDTRRRQQVAETVAYLEGIDAVLDRIDDEVDAIRAKYEGEKLLAVADRAPRINEFIAVRLVQEEYASMALLALMPSLDEMQEYGVDATTEEILAMWRGLILQSCRDNLELGAHYYVHYALYSIQKNLDTLNWTEEEKLELQALNEAAREGITKGDPSSNPIPYWPDYDPAITFGRHLQNLRQRR